MADTDYLAASDGSGNAALMHITSPRTALATVIQVDTVSGVPAFFIGTWGTLGADGFITAASARDFFGHVNAGTLVIDKMAPGNTDGGNTSGQVVVIKPSTQNQNLIANFVKTALNLFGQGQLLNGQLVPTINTNNLVLSVKTLANVDPSTTDVVYVRIGNTIRTITSALSVTLAAGTNWFSKGSTPMAASPTTFYAYLGYNATDGVTLGVASIANGYKYGDFSTTTTDFTYAKISNVAHAASTDVYENVGYFNAILGVSATFLWTLPAAASQIIVSQPGRNVAHAPVRFSVWLSAAVASGNGLFTRTPFDTKLYDTHNNIDIVTNKGRFTCTIPGWYQFIGHTSTAQGSGSHRWITTLFKNGSEISRGNDGWSASANNGGVAADLIYCAVGDTIEVQVFSDVALNYDNGGQYANKFTGYLAYPA